MGLNLEHPKVPTQNKKDFLILSILSFLFVIPLVSAQFFLSSPSQFINEAITGITDVFRPVLMTLFGNFGGEDFLFAKFLLGILLFVVINAVVRKIHVFKRQRGVAVIVALVISLLAIRFIDENDLVNGILLPYGTLGVAITTLLPFVIFFYFLHDSQIGPFGRRAGWFVFGVIFLVLWSSKYGEISPISNQIYGWTLIGVLLALIFDKGVHKYFALNELNRFKRHISDLDVAKLQAILRDIEGIDTPEANRARREIISRIGRKTSEEGFVSGGGIQIN